jgi:penicillin-binding protein 1A
MSCADMLEDRFGEELYRSRLRIHTTLDPVAQRAAEKELEAQLKQLRRTRAQGRRRAAGLVVMLEARTGDVLALVGGRDPTVVAVQPRTLARRQVGSAFKPFVFAAALQEACPRASSCWTRRCACSSRATTCGSRRTTTAAYEGEVSLRHALVRSRNIPTIRLASAVGIDDVARTARAAGVHAPMDETPALALGTVAMSPLQLATAYTTFATLGNTAEPRFVLRVEDEDGKRALEPDAPAPRRGMDPAVAYIVTDILRDAVDYGTGTGVRSAGYRGVWRARPARRTTRRTRGSWATRRTWWVRSGSATTGPVHSAAQQRAAASPLPYSAA